MDIFTAAFLGLVQGFSEFLPISSSGHLVIAQSLLPGFSQPGVLFDVILHFGTLFAVLIYYRRRLFTYSIKFWGLIALGTLPAVIVGLLFKNQIEGLFSAPKYVGFFLLITAAMNFTVDKFKKGNKNVNPVTALLVGFAQAVAIIPGISRSGSTITMGTGLGLSKSKAAEFSFLLSIPAILGASILQIADYASLAVIEWQPFAVGFLTAFIGGILSIKVLLTLLVESRFKVFGWYALFVGLLAILFL